MKKLESYGVGITVFSLILSLPVAGLAADQAEGAAADIAAGGVATYLAHCATCHGADGTGGGPVAEYLTVQPTDLTKIGESAGGEFPTDAVYEVIDGRQVPGHGSREMPIWGPAFMGMDDSSSKSSVKKKIDGLVDYLKSIQAPAG